LTPVIDMKTQTLPLKLRNGVIKTSHDSISVGSHFNVTSARQFSRAIARMAQRKPGRAIIDLSRTRSVDSSAFGALVWGLKRLADNGTTPVIVCANASMRRLMDFAGVNRSFTIVERASDARKVPPYGGIGDGREAIAS
jgi:anti-anti-sigma factor